MTFEKIERRLDGTNDIIWECLYLRVPEINELLAHVKSRKLQPFVYPMVCFAAHTGTRRSEITYHGNVPGSLMLDGPRNVEPKVEFQ